MLSELNRILPLGMTSQRVLRERIEDNIGKLSSGLKLRKASDGPSSLVSTDIYRARYLSLQQANENLQFGSNFLADDLTVTHSFDYILNKLGNNVGKVS